MDLAWLLNGVSRKPELMQGRGMLKKPPRVIIVSVIRRNEEILDLVEEFADVKGISRSDSLFYLSERMLN